MKRYILITLTLLIIGCSDNKEHQQPIQQVQSPPYYEQQQPVMPQQQQPVIMQQPMYIPQQQPQHSGADEMIQNLAIGAIAGHALSNIGGGGRQYQQSQTQHITKNVTINRTYNSPRRNRK